MDDEALHVRHVREQAEQLQAFGELAGGLGRALDLEREDGGGPVGIVLVVELLRAAGRKRRMVHALDLRVAVQEVDDFERVLDVALDTQRERFQTLQQDKRVEGGQRCALIAQERGARLGDIGGLACGFGEHDAVVARVRLRDAGELVGVAGPVELARIDDHAAHRRAVSADELRGGRDHHVGAVLDRA